VIACASIAVALALWVGRPDDGWLLRMRLGAVSNASLRRPPPVVILVTLVGPLVVVIPSTTSQLAVIAVGGAAAFGLTLHGRAAGRTDARAFRSDAATFLRAWSAELRAGLAPENAVRTAVGEASIWDPIRVAAAADIPAALLTVAGRPGGEALVDAAAAWTIADTTGAPLADVLARVSDGVQATVEIDREVAVEAAPARATARLMGFLPVIGILLGTTLGADPIGVLVGTGIGVTCLVFGLTLACCGVWWIERLVSAAES
jgi:tight adherence protein B